jgi:exosortase/archaeosortase family protein
LSHPQRSTPESDDASERDERAPARSTRRPVLRFACLLLASLAAFQFVFVRWIAPSSGFERYLELNARLAHAALAALGFRVHRSGTVIDVDGALLDIGAACAGLQPVAVFVLAVAAFPATWRSKLRGALVGVAALLAANQARILMLSLLRARASRAFELAHLYLWPMAFVLLTIALWVAWARRSANARG